MSDSVSLAKKCNIFRNVEGQISITNLIFFRKLCQEFRI